MKIGVPALSGVDYESKNGESVRYLYRIRHVTTVPLASACGFLRFFTRAFALPYHPLHSFFEYSMPRPSPDQITYRYKNLQINGFFLI